MPSPRMRPKPEAESPLPPETEGARSAFVGGLLAWYAERKRDLPWRRTRDPYAILVSEMMLQQTQVATVIPYWNRWMERFPTLAALAEAPLDDVLKQWQGLGYYARARNLHRAAQVVVARHDGVFPADFADILALPGIGRYTAGAVGSIALGLDVPIVDANVIRVLCRYFGLRGDPKSGAVQARLWQLAEELIPPGQAHTFNQAMMELGALVCESPPRCDICPVRAHCVAWATGRPEALPEFAPRPAFTTQTDVSAILTHPSGDGRLLLIRRVPTGLWAGLYEFPRVTAADGETVADAAIRAAAEIVGMAVTASETDVIGTVRHGVTTRKITLRAVACQTVSADEEPQPVGCDAALWVAPDDLTHYALSSPQARLAEQVVARERQLALF